MHCLVAQPVKPINIKFVISNLRYVLFVKSFIQVKLSKNFFDALAMHLKAAGPL